MILDSAYLQLYQFRLRHVEIGTEWEREKKKMAAEDDNGEFYLRYYVGHKGKFGHEFLEFEFRPDGKLRYANNSNYKNDTMIRKEVFLSPAVLKECRRIIDESEVFIFTTIWFSLS